MPPAAARRAAAPPINPFARRRPAAPVLLVLRACGCPAPRRHPHPLCDAQDIQPCPHAVNARCVPVRRKPTPSLPALVNLRLPSTRSMETAPAFGPRPLPSPPPLKIRSHGAPGPAGRRRALSVWSPARVAPTPGPLSCSQCVCVPRAPRGPLQSRARCVGRRARAQKNPLL
ncbi:MAG: hypothetical protein J3K34DRAFT_428454 [Monoraphidium minutum]|nr:MAG: hypothetical protein J3K34DRAFT_428454 [Monoraphidium minutum]